MAMPKPTSVCRAIGRNHPWPMVRLGDVCEINLGKTPPRGNARFWDKGRRDGYKWLSIADLANTQGGSVFDSKEYISKAAVEEVGVPVVLAGTFLLSFKLTLGRTAIAGCDLYTNEAIAAMPVKPAFQGSVDLQFLNLYCRFFDWEDFAAKDEKVLGKTLNKKKLAEVPLPLPPLSIQREVVARLERELAAVEKMKKGFETIAETAKAEFKAELNEVFEEISRGGAETRRLGEVCDVRDGTHDTPVKCDKGYLLLTSKNVRNGKVDKANAYYISASDYTSINKRSGVDRWDVLFSMIGTVGETAIVDKTPDFAIKNMGLFKTHANELLARWIKYLGRMKGSNQKFLSLGTLREFPLTLTNRDSMIRLVARLDGAKAKAEKLESKAREGVAVCETMRKAILKEAFE